jgi:hypothetical protein
MEPPIDSVEPDQQESYIIDQLKTLPALNKALVLKNSHVGGHKFAGNCIVSFAFVMDSTKADRPLTRYTCRKDPVSGMGE